MAVAMSELCASLSNDRLELVLMPTEACNFRCTYCYEDFRYARMAPDIVTGVKRFLSRRAPELRSLELSWFGGEPLLARDIVEDVQRHARMLVRRHPGMRFTSGITTNGALLSRPVCERLLDLGVGQFQVSFDGPREWHDRTRRTAGGRGTFDLVWKRLLALRRVERPFVVLVRLHASQDNEPMLPGFIESFAREFGSDGRFRLFLKPLAALGGPNDADFPYLHEEAKRRALDRLADAARAVGVEPLRADEVQPVCYAARGNSFVVRADGRLNKCTVALEHPNNQVGRLDSKGHIEIQAEAMRPWMRGLASGDEAELTCPMHGLADPVPQPAAAGGSVIWRGVAQAER